MEDLRSLLAGELREQNGEFQLVLGLNEDRFNGISVLLQGQSLADLHAFQRAVKQLRERGYRLTSLVADLRCPSGDVAPRIWKCEVRTKIGARPR